MAVLFAGGPSLVRLLDIFDLLHNLDLGFNFEHFFDKVLEDIVFILKFELLNLLQTLNLNVVLRRNSAGRLLLAQLNNGLPLLEHDLLLPLNKIILFLEANFESLVLNFEGLFD